ncbi:hypothetical protein D0Y65_041353 [Glycine soja]|uniref:Uncharacterized protein n=1 Tax=Glycine soja TaxID=3848 RepID=A0A445GVD0_GLYSO|nr:hypothetical protein D0Y65_041353 [Glycine soja]
MLLLTKVSFFVRVVAMEEAVLVLAFVGKLRRHLLLLVVAMVLVLLVSSFASPLSDEVSGSSGLQNSSFVFGMSTGWVVIWLQITEHQSKFKDGEDIPPLVVCYILVTLSAIVTSSGSDMTLSSSDDRVQDVAELLDMMVEDIPFSGIFPKRFRLAKDTTFGQRHLNKWSQSSISLWMVEGEFEFSMVMNDHYKGNSFLNYKVQKSPNRGKNQVKASCNVGWTTEMDSQPSGSAADVVDVNESGSSKLGGSEPEGAVLCLQDRLKWLNQQVIRKVV